MGPIKQLYDRTVFLDTAPLIYYIEENPRYVGLLDELFLSNSKKEFLFKTSTITLLEVLVQPMRENEYRLVNEYQNILCKSDTIQVLGLNIEIAKTAAGLRAKYRIKTPDAIQVATAVYTSSDYFLTNDIRLKSVSEINILVLDELISLS